MDTFLMTGIIVGAVIGLAHAIHLYRERIANAYRGTASAMWFAAWTMLLWTILGPYVLAAWLVGVIGLAASRLRRVVGPAQ